MGERKALPTKIGLYVASRETDGEVSCFATVGDSKDRLNTRLPSPQLTCESGSKNKDG
jgi:hypothetical protein